MHKENVLLIYYVRIHIWCSLVEGFNLHKLIQVRKSGYNTKPLFNFLALMAIYLIMSQQIDNCTQMVLLPSFQQHHNSFINMSKNKSRLYFAFYLYSIEYKGLSSYAISNVNLNVGIYLFEHLKQEGTLPCSLHFE